MNTPPWEVGPGQRGTGTEGGGATSRGGEVSNHLQEPAQKKRIVEENWLHTERNCQKPLARVPVVLKQKAEFLEISGVSHRRCLITGQAWLLERKAHWRSPPPCPKAGNAPKMTVRPGGWSVDKPVFWTRGGGRNVL